MLIRDLIEQLEDLAAEHGDQAEVRLAQQPRWAFEYAVEDAVAAAPRRGAAPVIYLAEGRQLGYLPQAAAVALGWARAEPDEDEAEDECEPGTHDWQAQRGAVDVCAKCQAVRR